jgi:hypothetical protein
MSTATTNGAGRKRPAPGGPTGLVAKRAANWSLNGPDQRPMRAQAPGGEQDAMRNWRKRDKAVLAGRKGFVRFALRQQVPIVPVATVGGHDKAYVDSIYREVEAAIQAGMDRLAKRRSFPIFG